jgi:hypothetical protein
MPAQNGILLAHRREGFMPDEATRRKGSLGPSIAALATIVLTILGLAHVVPEYLVAIATIVFGATLLLHGSAMVAEYARLNARPGAATASAAITRDGGLSVVFLAGAAGVVLGILALLGISTIELTAIAVIAFGAASILSSSSEMRMHLLSLSLATPDERAQRLAGDALAGEMLSSSAGIFGLVGLSAIVLGILALAGFSPVVLILIALLALGSVTALNGVDFTDAIVSVYRRA